ncbi:hypothetical protein [Imbroritus primus]|uniref:hypothetical protein n=1 Tax=Imbroritus primus TaxID=3058603 RepID=UPI003D162101
MTIQNTRALPGTPSSLPLSSSASVPGPATRLQNHILASTRAALRLPGMPQTRIAGEALTGGRSTMASTPTSPNARTRSKL